MLKLHHDDYGAYHLDHDSGEYTLTHFCDPGGIPNAVVQMPVEVAVTQAREILERSAPHLLVGHRAKSTPEMFAKLFDGSVNDRRGEVVPFRGRA